MQDSKPHGAPHLTIDSATPRSSRLGASAAALLAGTASVLMFRFVESRVVNAHQQPSLVQANVLLAVTFATTQCVAAVAAISGARANRTIVAMRDDARHGAAAATMAMLGVIVALCILRFLHNVKRRGVADIIDFEWLLAWIVIGAFYVAAAAGVGAGVGVLMRKLGSPRRP